MLGAQEQARNSRGKRAISARETEVLLYLDGVGTTLINVISPVSRS